MWKKYAVIAACALVIPSAVALGGMSLTGSGNWWMLAQQEETSDTAGQQQPSREEKERQEKAGVQSAQMQEHVLAADLMDMDVYNHKNEKIGTLTDIAFDEQHQQVAHAVLSSGGFLGIGAKRYAVPWDQVTAQLSMGRVMVPIEKATLENSPTIQDEGHEMQNASEIINAKVQLASGGGTLPPSDDAVEDRGATRERGDEDEAGEIVDLLISNDGQLQIAVIRPNPEFFEGVEEYEMLAVPWTSMQVMPEDDMVMANFSQAQAQQLTVNQYELTRLEDPSFQSQLYSAVGAQQPQMAQSDGQQRNGQQPNGPQPGQSQEMQKWSSFAEQCLGAGQANATDSVSGTVEEVGTLSPGQDAEAPSGLQLTLSGTGDQQPITVYAGPRDQARELKISQGDQVNMTGTRCQIDGEQVFVASSIRTNGTEYRLTERNGVPQWSTNGQHKSNQQQPGEKPGSPGR